MRHHQRAADRLALAAAAVAVVTRWARGSHVSAPEQEVFRAVNGLPDGPYPAIWAIMQCGTLAAAPLAAGVAWVKGERRLAGRLLLVGTATWALSKVFKRAVRRPRPAALVPGTHVRGAAATGLGYLSGHAGVAAALASAAAPTCKGSERLVLLAAAPLVGLARMYVGAHLPLDVAGGVALGVGVEAAVRLLSGDPRDTPTRV